jgi:hypothetical protein
VTQEIQRAEFHEIMHEAHTALWKIEIRILKMLPIVRIQSLDLEKDLRYMIAEKEKIISCSQRLRGLFEEMTDEPNRTPAE